MVVNCYYCGFGAVHSIMFKNDNNVIFNSGVRNMQLNSNITCNYNYESVAFYFLADYIKKFFNENPRTKRIVLFTAIDSFVISNAMNNPNNASEAYLSELYHNKQLLFDARGDEVLSAMSNPVARTFFTNKKNGEDVKFGKKDDFFADMYGDRYGIYS